MSAWLIVIVLVLFMCVFSVGAPVGASYYYDEPVTSTISRIPGSLGLTTTTTTTSSTTSSDGSTSSSDGGAQVIIREVSKPCPNPPACTCPECPDCKCPECPECNCPVTDNQLRAAEAESKYLKWMVRFLGSIARRENAINRVMAKECPGVFAMVPTVQEVDQETQFIQKHIRKDDDMYRYFQTNFSKYSGIPATMYKEEL